MSDSDVDGIALVHVHERRLRETKVVARRTVHIDGPDQHSLPVALGTDDLSGSMVRQRIVSRCA